MIVKHKLLTTLAVAAMAAGSFAAAAPANAGTQALSQCKSQWMCLWGNNDFTWYLSGTVHGQSNWKNLTGEANDQMDSWANLSNTHTGCMAKNANGGGSRYTMKTVSRDNNVNPTISDSISSYKTYGGC